LCASGRVLLPKAHPIDGYDGSKRYVNFTASDCETNMCLVDHVSGLLPELCSKHKDAPCARESDVAARVCCTCRCDAPSADATCTCPCGYRCELAVEPTQPELAGSYCNKAE